MSLGWGWPGMIRRWDPNVYGYNLLHLLLSRRRVLYASRISGLSKLQVDTVALKG